MPDPMMLPEQLDTVAAGPLLDAFRSRIGQPLTIDASAVVRASTPALQVILAAARTWREANQPMAIASPSPTFMSAVTLLGIADAFPGLEVLPA
jgi:anti-anti-sigma regulatory factor